MHCFCARASLSFYYLLAFVSRVVPRAPAPPPHQDWYCPKIFCYIRTFVMARWKFWWIYTRGKSEGCDDLSEITWTPKATARVGSDPPNLFLIRRLSLCVSEWVSMSTSFSLSPLGKDTVVLGAHFSLSAMKVSAHVLFAPVPVNSLSLRRWTPEFPSRVMCDRHRN